MAEARSGQMPPQSIPSAPTPSKNAQTPSTNRNQQKRHHRPHKNNAQPYQQVDGAVSDSYACPTTSPHQKHAQKPRHQSVAIGTPARANGHLSAMNGDRQRPVSTGGNVQTTTPLKEQAYAGPTFQASPAPSSLPVPKFFSRSVPNVAGKSLAARMEGEKVLEHSDSSPEADVVAPVGAGQKSPLDMFFNADKMEKERSRNNGSLSPEMALKRAPPATEPRKMPKSGKNAFLRELDGGNGNMPSPKTVPIPQPLHAPQRPNTSPSVSDSATAPTNESDRQAQTQALKDLLFNNINNSTSPPPSSATPPAQQAREYTPDHMYQTPSPFMQRPTSGPSTPAPASARQQTQNSLHYGDQRNLSPLFKAARSETLPRPSGLRHQEYAPTIPHTTTTNINQPRPHDNEQHRIDPNDFSRNYINQHFNGAAGPTVMPRLPFDNAPNDSTLPHAYSNIPPGQRNPQQGANNGLPPSFGGAPATNTTTSSAGSSRDVKGMEDDLRRMLNLNVLSN